MRYKFLFLVAFLNLIIIHILSAQDKIPVKFGKVLPADFNIEKLNVDTSSGAVIIAEVGTSMFEGNDKGWFTLIFKIQRRIKITGKNGFDLATVSIPLYFKDKDEERAEKIKATTYNLENGVVVETKLENNAIFKDKLDKNHIVQKFTMPSVKEGAILEYSYTITSDFLFNLHSWDFQGTYPRVWSEYETRIPEFFDYVFLSQGYHPFFKKKTTSNSAIYYITLQSNEAFSRPEIVRLTGTENENHWIMKDVPGLKEEKYTSSLNNHIAKIEFQLSGTKFPNQVYKKIMGNWLDASEELLKSEDFGLKLNKSNNWLDDDLKSITTGAYGQIAKAKKIYNYVKNNIKSTDRRGIFLTKSIKEVFSSKSGSVAEINMLLITMLKHENLDAAPVILSTTGHGYTNELYPLIDRFNYLICKFTVDTTNYFLDASETQMGFGYLPPYCYNGHARVIEKTPTPLYFLADTLTETKSTSVMLFNDEKIKGKWSGNVNSDLGYYESWDKRNEITEHGKSDFIKSLTGSYTGNLSIGDITIEELDSCEKPVKLKFLLNVDNNGEQDVIYFNPMLNEGYRQNYFKSPDRKYPVEMPYKIDETFSLYLDIPEGYTVDEVPKSTKVILNETDGYFEYLISPNETSINLRSHLKLEKATFLPDEYEGLKSFFDYVIKKHSEQIVFKVKNK